jgi:hypothetical protein
MRKSFVLAALLSVLGAAAFGADKVRVTLMRWPYT